MTSLVSGDNADNCDLGVQTVQFIKLLWFVKIHENDKLKKIFGWSRLLPD